jgi:hypothetical protein
VSWITHATLVRFINADVIGYATETSVNYELLFDNSHLTDAQDSISIEIGVSKSIILDNHGGESGIRLNALLPELE